MTQALPATKLEGVLLLLLFITSALSDEPSDWSRIARRLTGEGEGVREQAVAALKRIPGLEGELKQALHDERPFLALDVVVALNLRTLWHEVIRASEKDRSGFSYLALDALVDSVHQPELSKIYLERLKKSETSPASKVVILDSLIRLNVRMSERELAPLLLEEPSPEVRSAALYYLRGFLLRRDAGYLPMFKHFLEGKLSRQLKAQALALAGEIPNAPQDLKVLCEKLGNPSH